MKSLNYRSYDDPFQHKSKDEGPATQFIISETIQKKKENSETV